MRVMVLGAGAIGSLFGGLLSKNNDVTLVGREAHVEQVKKHGLKITGEIDAVVHPYAVCDVSEAEGKPDLLLITVKSYDTGEAAEIAKKVVGGETLILSLQNGLDNLEKITSVLGERNVVAGVTTEGSLFLKPGEIKYTGRGSTVVGEINGSVSERVRKVAEVFNTAGFKTSVSGSMIREIWKKAVVNASINPITALFDIKNGEVLQHKPLYEFMRRACVEAVRVARKVGMEMDEEEMVEKTQEVLRVTAENYSSMVQSLRKGKFTEIDSINGYMLRMAVKYGVRVPINELLVKMVKIREEMMR